MSHKLIQKTIAAVLSVSVFSLDAEVFLVSPEDAHEVQLLPDAQKTVFAVKGQDARRELLNAKDEQGKSLRDDKYWRKAKPLSVSWKVTEGEKGPWQIKLATKKDMSDARFIPVAEKGAKEKKGNFSYTIPFANLKPATTYYWQVLSDVRCPEFTHGKNCTCAKNKPTHASAVGSFTTEDVAPRWIEIEGRVANIRDLGNWKTQDGKRVKMGMIFRGQGLNDNSEDGATRARNRLMVEDVDFLVNVLGIKTDLDLRSDREVAGMNGVSPLGKGVRFVHHSSMHYDAIFTKAGKEMMAKNFRLFCDPENYPIYFHCIAGADRTGALAFVLNGVLGVDQHDLEIDWESTFYPKLPGSQYEKSWRWMGHITKGLDKYDGENLRRRIELYLNDCGITDEEIARFRSIMLEQ